MLLHVSSSDQPKEKRNIFKSFEILTYDFESWHNGDYLVFRLSVKADPKRVHNLNLLCAYQCQAPLPPIGARVGYYNVHWRKFWPKGWGIWPDRGWGGAFDHAHRRALRDYCTRALTLLRMAISRPRGVHVQPRFFQKLADTFQVLFFSTCDTTWKTVCERELVTWNMAKEVLVELLAKKRPV